MEWLDESEKTLDSEAEVANDPGKLKIQLSQHKVPEHHATGALELTYYTSNQR